ncbi:MAG: DUF4386 family protein [Dehalococcoidia bacterium]
MDRKLFLSGGISALVYAVVTAVVATYISSVEGPPTAGAKEVLQNIAGAPEALRWFGLGGAMINLLLIPAALALYFGLRDREPSYAVLGLVAVLFMAMVVMIQSTANAAMDWKLGQAYATGSPAEKTAALLIFEAVGNWGLLTAPGFRAGFVGIGLFGLAMLGSTAFPRWLGWVGIVGGALGLIGQASWFIEALVVVVFVSWLVVLGWVFLAGIYLLKVKPA